MYLAIDVGGTKTLLTVFDGSGKIKESHKFKTPVKYGEFKPALKTGLSKLKTKSYKLACMGIPGKVDRKAGVGIAFGNLPWLNIPIKKDIREFITCDLLIENDANLAGLHEALLLDGEFRKILYVTVSTGIGGGFIIDGKISPDFQDAEVGHLLLEHDGKLMEWEDFGSGKAFVKKYGKLVSEIEEEDNAAWYLLARNIAIGMIDLVATLTPEVIIIGGGVGAHLPKFKDRLVGELKIYENPLLEIPEIRQAQDSETAVVYGAYNLMRQYEHN